jgi:Transcriptional regulator
MYFNKKEEILDIVKGLFSQKGYMLSMSDIAECVKIKVPSLYSHFSSKDEIIYKVVEKEINNYYDSLIIFFKKSKNEESKTILEGYYLHIFAYFDTREKIKFWHNIYLIQNEDLRKKCKKLIVFRNETNLKKIKSIFEEGMLKGEIKKSDKEPELLYLAMIQGILEGILVYGDVSRLYTEKIWEAFWDGIRIP